MLLRILIVMLLSITPVLASVMPAAACSCKSSEDVFRTTDGAFVGHYVTSVNSDGVVADTVSAEGSKNHIFEVEHVLNGDIDSMIVVHGGVNPGMCGFPDFHPDGEPVGIMFHTDDAGVHRGSGCTMASPETLMTYGSDSSYVPVSLISQQQAIDAAVIPEEYIRQDPKATQRTRLLQVIGLAGAVTVLVFGAYRLKTGSFIR